MTSRLNHAMKGERELGGVREEEERRGRGKKPKRGPKGVKRRTKRERAHGLNGRQGSIEREAGEGD